MNRAPGCGWHVRNYGMVTLLVLAAQAPPALADIASTPCSNGLDVLAVPAIRDPLKQVVAEFQRRTGCKVRVSYQTSATQLARINSGHAADMLISANDVEVDAALAMGLFDLPGIELADDRLVLVSVADAGAIAKAQSLADLAKPGLRIVDTRSDVTVGRLSRRVLATVGRKLPDGNTFLAGVKRNTVVIAGNGRIACEFLQQGKGDAALVYESDVPLSSSLYIAYLPEKYKGTALFRLMTIAKSKQKALAASFVLLATSDFAGASLRRFRFKPIEGVRE